MRADTQGFATVLDLDNQVIRLAAHRHIRRIQAFQANHIQLANRGVVVGVVVDGVLARAFAKHISVGTIATVQRIVTGSAIKGVVTVATTKGVSAIATFEGIVTLQAVEQIVARQTQQIIGRVVTRNGLITFGASQQRRPDLRIGQH